MIEALLGPLQRAALQSGTVFVVGVGAWTWIVGPAADGLLRAEGNGSEPRRDLTRLRRAIIRSGSWVTGLLLPFWALGLVVQVAGFRDPFVPLREDVLFLLGSTFWGSVWLAQGLVLLLLGLSLRTLAGSGEPTDTSSSDEAIRPLGPRSTVTAVLIVALPVTLALSSHAMAVSGGHRIVAVAADASHALAAGTWIGSLALIVFVSRRSADRGLLVAAQLRAFSPMALVAVPVLLVMGGVLSVYHLSSIADLWSHPYGRLLSAKLLAAGAVLLLGLLNWRRGIPSLSSEAGRRMVRRRATWEVAAAALALAVTGVLTGTASP